MVKSPGLWSQSLLLAHLRPRRHLHGGSRRRERRLCRSNLLCKFCTTDMLVAPLHFLSGHIHAITFATVGGFSTALVVALLFVSTFVPLNLAAYVAVLFVFAMISLLAAFLSFLVEIRIAIAALRIGGQ